MVNRFDRRFSLAEDCDELDLTWEDTDESREATLSTLCCDL